MGRSAPMSSPASTTMVENYDLVEAPTVVSLFAGAGGTDIGLERAGWSTVVAADRDANCIGTLQHAKKDRIAVRGQPGRFHLERTVLKLGDLREMKAADFRPAGSSDDWRPDLLAGGPPCQPWSSSGLQKGWADARGLLVEQFIRLTSELHPRFVLFENVRGLLTAVGPCGQPGEILQRIKASFEDLGYATTFATINAADYGAPQRRVRLFMMATLDYALPHFPVATHQSAATVRESETKPWISLDDFLATLPAPGPDDIVRPTPTRNAELAQLQPGTGLRTKGRIENNRPSGHWGYRQDAFLADPRLPARTIRAATTPDWLRLSDGTYRRLTWKECAALQGFPSEWPFQGTPTVRFRQIGNAIQAEVAEVLGNAMLMSYRKGALNERPTSEPLPAEFARRINYTAAEHRTNGSHRIRVRASVT